MAVLGSRDPKERPVARWQWRQGVNAAARLPLVVVTPFKVKQSPLPPSLVRKNTGSASLRPRWGTGGDEAARSLEGASAAQIQSITADSFLLSRDRKFGIN